MAGKLKKGEKVSSFPRRLAGEYPLTVNNLNILRE
jgi:hypothetical protein